MGVSCCSFLEVWRKWHFPLIRGFPPSRSSPCRGDGAYAILWPCHETATKTNICFLPFLFKGIIAASRNNNKLPVLTMISSKNRICKCSHFRSVLFQSNRLFNTYGRFLRIHSVESSPLKYTEMTPNMVLHNKPPPDSQPYHRHPNFPHFKCSEIFFQLIWYLEKSFNWYLEIFFGLDLKARTTSGQRLDFVHQGQRDVSPIEQLFGRLVIPFPDVSSGERNAVIFKSQ